MIRRRTMCKTRLLSAYLITILIASSSFAANAFKEDFSDKDIRGWVAVSGNWVVADGQLVQKENGWGRYMILPPVRLEAGTIRARMRVDRCAPPSGPSFGFVLRHPGEKTYTALRIGAYGHTQLMQPVKDTRFHDFKPKVGQFYDVKAELAGDTVTLSIDGKAFGSAKMAEPDAPGTIGFYTECEATFDDLEVTGTWRGLGEKKARTGTPRLEVQFAEWQPVNMDTAVSLSVSGAVQVYFRNVGTGSAVLDHVMVMGKKVDRIDAPSWVVYARQRPMEVKPGASGQLELRLNGLPKSVGLQLVENAAGPVTIPIVIAPQGGEPVRAVVDITRPSLLQVNFMGFSPDLRTIYVYVQNNAAVLRGEEKHVRITGLAVDGTDVMASSRLGATTVFRDVVPVEITLPKPLAKGHPVRVVLTTAEGIRTGHVLRAFPSKFNILVSTNHSQARKDYMEDIYNHCATAINYFGLYPDQFERFGFDVIPMSGSNPLANAKAFQNSPIEGIWMDEVDKSAKGYSIRGLLRSIEDTEEHLESKGELLPLLAFNLVRPTQAATSGHLMLPDAVMHSYGRFMCPNVNKGFGRLATLHSREYRQARRPFWPYFRDSEIAVPCDPVKKIMLPRHKAFQRCLTPKEQRWLTYGNLIQGAKSTAHWGYWARPMSKFYFMWTQSVLRLGLGAPASGRVGPYVLEPAVAKMLEDVWAEHGRINAELRVIGPLVAISDVSYLARITEVTPAKDKYGEPAAEAAALVSGLDTMIVVALNHNIDAGKSPFKPSGAVSNPNPPRYDPVAATVEVRVPAWLKPKYIFSVSHEEIASVSPQRTGDRLRFAIPKLEVSKLYVITSSDNVKRECLARHSEMKKRLAKTKATKPVFRDEWKDRKVE